MAGSTYGTLFTITTWGESHGPGVGVVIDGCPAGLPLSSEDIQKYLDRRRPGQSRYTTARNEADEAEILSGMTITDTAGMEAAAKAISERYGCAVLCKGGHQVNDADDLLWRNGGGKWFRGKRIHNPNTHGTGCTLSSAIASNLAKGFDLDTSVERAKAYISGALGAMLDLGRGSGPMNHMFDLKSVYCAEKAD